MNALIGNEDDELVAPINPDGEVSGKPELEQGLELGRYLRFFGENMVDGISDG